MPSYIVCYEFLPFLTQTWFPSFMMQVRDDNKRQHPCLVEFSRLPEQERSYNLQMSQETLKLVSSDVFDMCLT